MCAFTITNVTYSIYKLHNHTCCLNCQFAVLYSADCTARAHKYIMGNNAPGSSRLCPPVLAAAGAASELGLLPDLLAAGHAAAAEPPAAAPLQAGLALPGPAQGWVLCRQSRGGYPHLPRMVSRRTRCTIAASSSESEKLWPLPGPDTELERDTLATPGHGDHTEHAN